MTKYEHITTVMGKRLSRQRDVNGDRYYMVVLEDDLWDHTVCLNLEEWRHLKLGDGIRITLEELS